MRQEAVESVRWKRSARFESCEPRLVMAADPFGPIQLDDFFEAQLAAQAETALTPQATLAEAHQQTGLTNVRNSYGFEGAGQTVAIIDSGVAWDHIALGGGFGQSYRFVGGWDFAENDAIPYDDGLAGSHGTHVAGIVGGDDGQNVGVAPGVDLVALRVFNDSGQGYFSWVEEALQWVHRNRNAFENPITTVNLSLGADWNSSNVPNWATLENEFAQLEADGIFIAVAAGNSFAKYNAPGLSYPAASQYVTPVSSVDANGALSSFSQRDPRAIAAPGRSILSSVPDYVGDQNGRNDDYSAYSGTSMATPYVAGASVLIREALQFVGQANITQDSIYEIMAGTADSVWDAATSAWYKRLNLARAVDSILPADDYGSTLATAQQLGTLQASQALSGMIGRLDDRDYFTFTASAAGTVTLSVDVSAGTTPSWWSSIDGKTLADGSFQFTVAAGSSYTFSLSAAGSLARYQLDLGWTPAQTVTDWGVVAFQQSADQAVAGESWHRLVASQTGLFTAEAFFAHAAGDINLELYNASRNTRLAASQGVGNQERIDFQVAAGDILYLKIVGKNSDVDLRLTNLVSTNAGEIFVHGTEGGDSFTFATDTQHRLSVNGVAYQFAAASYNKITFSGAGGEDAIHATLSSAVDRVQFQAAATSAVSANFRLDLREIESTAISGGGGADEAFFYDTAGAEVFTAAPRAAQMVGQKFDHRAEEFARIVGYSTGGDDRAVFVGAAGPDSFTARSQNSQMIGVGYANYAEGFNRVTAHSMGGRDFAYLHDSAGDDVFTAWNTHAILQAGGREFEARGFNQVKAHASSGDDVAHLYDTAADEVFTADSQFARMTGYRFNNRADGFDRTYAYATTGADVAHLYDSSGDDRYTAKPRLAVMEGANFSNTASGFAQNYGYASQGVDQVVFYGAAGPDAYTSQRTEHQMLGVGYANFASGFDRAEAYSMGGRDFAYLYDSAGDDLYRAWNTHSIMLAAGCETVVQGFNQVKAYATLGRDAAYFYDTAGDDVYTATPQFARMTGERFNNRADGFVNCFTVSTGGFDVAVLYDSTGAERLEASAALAQWSGARFSHTMSGYRQVAAYSSGGGDAAQLHRSSPAEQFSLQAAYAALQTTDFALAVHGFAQVREVETSLEAVDVMFEGW